MSQLDLSTVKFTACKSIVTDYEYRIYDILLHKLEQDYPDQYVVCPKVRIVDIVNMDNEDDFGLWQRIKSRHVDFLICTKQFLEPVLAIELQDSTHKTGKGRYRDMLVSNVFKSAGIELLELRTIKKQDVEKLLYWKLKPYQLAIAGSTINHYNIDANKPINVSYDRDKKTNSWSEWLVALFG